MEEKTEKNRTSDNLEVHYSSIKIQKEQEKILTNETSETERTRRRGQRRDVSYARSNLFNERHAEFAYVAGFAKRRNSTNHINARAKVSFC